MTATITPAPAVAKKPLFGAEEIKAIKDPLWDNNPIALQVLGTYADRPGAILLLSEGFDMLEEDFEEERLFAAVRRAYWAAPDRSPMRQLCEQLITRLDF